MDSIIALASFVALAPACCKMAEELMLDTGLIRKIRRAPPKRVLPEGVTVDEKRSVFDAHVRVYPSRGHTHSVVRQGRKLRLIGNHEHVVTLDDADFEALAKDGMLHLQSSLAGGFDADYHSHKIILSL